jgi:hypothetical protein
MFRRQCRIHRLRVCRLLPHRRNDRTVLEGFGPWSGGSWEYTPTHVRETAIAFIANKYSRKRTGRDGDIGGSISATVLVIGPDKATCTEDFLFTEVDLVELVLIRNGGIPNVSKIVLDDRVSIGAEGTYY